MTRQTSIDTFVQIKNEGLLSKMRLKVYKAIFNKAPCTSAEAMEGIMTPDNVLSQSRARFTELRDRGVIKEIGKRLCKITGRNVIVWDLTDMLPVEPQRVNVRPRGFKKVIEYMIDMMEKTNTKSFTVLQLKNIKFNKI